MHLIYFDENKYEAANPYFWIGGVLIPEPKAIGCDKTLLQIQFNALGKAHLGKDSELHGKDIFHGKGNFKGRKLAERIALIRQLVDFVLDNRIPVQLISIDVNAHRAKYKYPTPEYRLGLMLMLERACDYLDSVNDLGVVFGDHEADEMSGSIADFSSYKAIGTTPMYRGRPLGRLLDTVYFTHSHHSRCLQLADMLVFLAGRYGRMQESDVRPVWHEQEAFASWKKLKASMDTKIQHWP
jgi:hypothetical protein